MNIFIVSTLISDNKIVSEAIFISLPDRPNEFYGWETTWQLLVLHMKSIICQIVMFCINRLNLNISSALTSHIKLSGNEKVFTCCCCLKLMNTEGKKSLNTSNQTKQALVGCCSLKGQRGKRSGLTH